MSTAVATSLLERLKEIQTREGLSDYKFADKLGVSHQLWQMVRTGDRQISCSPLLSGIVKAYPELYWNGDVFFFLCSDVEASLVGVGKSYAPSEKRPDAGFSRFKTWLRDCIKSLIWRV